MTKPLALSLLAMVLICAALPALAGAPVQQMSFRSFTIQGQSLQGALQGPWEWTGSVTATGSGLTLTCDSLKLWLTPDGRDAERVEASGNIHITGRYLAADKTAWDINGQAKSATFERKTGQGILQGSVDFEAKNPVTGATVSAAAEKLIYDMQTKHFRFERGAQPVRMEWQEPAPPAPSNAQESPGQK
jgi:lipopolysaccharide export system protein LptA